MEAVPFKDQDGELGIGKNDPDRVHSLPCKTVDLGDGYKGIVSCWRLTKPELEEVNRTGVVWLTACGGMYPTKIDGIKPF